MKFIIILILLVIKIKFSSEADCSEAIEAIIEEMKEQKIITDKIEFEGVDLHPIKITKIFVLDLTSLVSDGSCEFEFDKSDEFIDINAKFKATNLTILADFSISILFQRILGDAKLTVDQINAEATLKVSFPVESVEVNKFEITNFVGTKVKELNGFSLSILDPSLLKTLGNVAVTILKKDIEQRFLDLLTNNAEKLTEIIRDNI
ncbi:uncharacterized protein LOC111623646 [Centruroides sculpturatus]|uniref:uncharacterized protein LOC111623645 n=1 Tax=Centruroides sculpturatus TaxID=218467 RepID=UPI000C6D875C|nr:uncharacterized protein LOC111623645 [Centruroides sculpturatus]XP_023222076.1 uncharacterized protein LOC111623646 [Centruroides sculpturatus]